MVISRRQLAAAALAAAASARISATAATTAPAASAATPRPAQEGPPFLLGSHQHGKPDNTDRFPAGTFKGSVHTMEPFDYGPIRSHNVEMLNAGAHNRWWTGREAGANRYDWSVLDRWVDKVTGRGHAILLNLFGVPEFAARLRDYRDVYGVTGGTSGPADLVAWEQFTRDTTARIVGRIGAARLVGVEAWNEAVGGDKGGEGKFLVSRGYAAGHDDPQAALLADITKHTHLGVRAVAAAAGVPVIFGAHAYHDEKNIDRLLNARTTRGESILQFADAISFHPYGVFDPNAVRPGLTELTRLLRRKLERLGRGQMPLWASEVAINAPWHKNVASWWGRKNTTERAEALYQWIALYRQLGWYSVFTYGSDNTEDFLGLPQSNPELAAALTRAYRELHRT